MSNCEPMRAWSALQSRPRTTEFDQSLKAGIHDPLWMLTRQWQFGEFKGEDAGSAIFVKVRLDTSAISKYQTQDQPAVAYDDSLPLEARVERMPITLDYRLRAAIGKQWLAMLDEEGATYNAGSPAVLYDAAAAKTLLVSLYTFELPTIAVETDAAGLTVEKAKLLSNRTANPVVTALAGRAVDGAKWYEALTAGSGAAIPAEVKSAIDAALLPVYEAAMTRFTAWCEELYCRPESKDDSAWNPSQLEYQFRCAAPAAIGNNTILTANEYYHGRLDFNDFNLGPDDGTESDLLSSTEEERTAAQNTQVLTVMANQAGFGGMPSPRWWEFEDGAIDFGNLNAETTEIAKIILAEFALVYSNDWLLVPHTIPVGTLAKIGGIVVTDTFGQRTLVEAAGQGDSNDWQSWTLYNMTKNEADSAVASTLDHRLFLVPAVAKVQESAPLESVAFLRDETSNLVWAVESRIPDWVGGSMDAQTAQRRLADYLAALEPVTEETETEVEAETKYTLGSSVPENWIPFISIHLDGTNRAMQLQRASMPRYWNGQYLAIRPRTDILRTGMYANRSTEEMPFVNALQDTQEDPYYIYEEEVPSTGVVVQAAFNRTRWYDGKTLVWYARQKQVGRGEGASGLHFDIVTENQTQSTEV